jgi:hypothetical protein
MKGFEGAVRSNQTLEEDVDGLARGLPKRSSSDHACRRRVEGLAAAPSSSGHDSHCRADHRKHLPTCHQGGCHYNQTSMASAEIALRAVNSRDFPNANEHARRQDQGITI